MVQSIQFPLVPPLILKPINGERTSLIPIFLWSPIYSATGYEFVIAKDIGMLDKFAIIDYSASTAITGHTTRETLKQNAVYYWRVRAVRGNERGPWSIGFFTTMEKSPKPKVLSQTQNDKSPTSSVVTTPLKTSILYDSKNTNNWDYQSVFISYGDPDEDFANRINQALQEHGISTFFFPLHAIPGQKLHRLMHEGVNNHRHVLLICSENSLNRLGVMNELEETLQREAREGGSSILIPITIDDYVFKNWKPDREDIAQRVRDRVISDFSKAVNNPMLFEKEVQRLIIGITSNIK